MSRSWLFVLGAYVLCVLVLSIGAWLDGDTAVAAEETPTFVGADSCKACHFKQHKTWNKTTMAKTFSVLLPNIATEKKVAAKLDPAKDYSSDPKCLKCHTTGYGQPSGYPAVVPDKAFTPEETARAELNKGVTCEACHGPGSLYGPFKKENKDYKRAEIVALGAIAPVTAETCTPCHVKECPTMPEDYKFDFASKKDSKDIHAHKKLKRPH